MMRGEEIDIPFFWETSIHLSHTTNNMGANVMAKQGNKASAALILT